MSLKLINITKNFNKVVAVNKRNIEVNQGESFSFLGPSGCGKSTFIRTVNRMNDLIPTFSHDGNISLDGVDVYDDAVDVVDLRKRGP